MSIGTIVTIASYVSFALIILISFWVGFRRGVKRSAIYLGISFALILVAFFITAPISRAILGISVSVDGISKPISQIIVDTVSQEATIAAALESSPTLTSFLEVLPTFVINIVVFIILFIIMRLLAYIVYKIIECTCLKSKKKEKELGLKRNRWCGSLIGVAKAFLFIIIGFAPLSALLGFAEDLKTQTASTYTVSESNTQSTSIPTTDSLLNSVPVSVTDGIYSYNHNVYGVLCGIFNFDNFVFDNLTKINVAGENIAVRQDILNYATVYNTIAEITKAIQQPQGESFKDLDWIKMDKCVNQILESGLIKGLVTNLIGDFINNYSKFSQFDLSEYEKVLDKISSSFTNDTVKEYFLNDFKQVYSTVSCAGKSGILDTLIFDKDSSTQEKIEDVLSEENKDSLLKMISSILDMNILKDAISPILDLALTKVDSATFDFNSPNTEVSDWTSFKSSILNIIGGAIDINNTISIVSLIDNPISALNISTSKVDSLLIDLGKVLDNINSLSILTDKDGNKIVDKLCKKIGLSNILNVQGETSINNYSKLLNYLNPSIKKLLSFNLYSSLENGDETGEIVENIIKKLSDETTGVGNSKVYSTSFTDIISSVYKVEGLRNFLTKTLEEASSASGFIDLSSLNVYTNSVLDYNKSYNNWTKESSLLTRIFVELYRTKIGTETEQRNLIHALLVNGENFADIIKEVPSNSIGFVIKPILYSKSLKSIIDNTFNMVSSNMNNITGKTTTLNTTSITLEEGTIEDQADEICAILTKIIEILPSTGSISSLDDISYSQLGKLLDTIKLNAYRVELTTEDESPKEEVGLFKGLFTDLYDKLKTEYPESTDIIASKQPYEINFENLLSIVESLQKATEGSFISNLQNIVSSEAITIENIETLINTVDSETNQEEIQTLLDQIDELEYTIEIPGDTEEEVNNNKSSIGDALNNNTELDESTKEKIKNLLGIE